MSRNVIYFDQDDSIVFETEANPLLNEARRNALIDELKERQSITYIKVKESEGAVIQTSEANVSVCGEAYIFVITPFQED